MMPCTCSEILRKVVLHSKFDLDLSICVDSAGDRLLHKLVKCFTRDEVTCAAERHGASLDLCNEKGESVRQRMDAQLEWIFRSPSSPRQDEKQ